MAFTTNLTGTTQVDDSLIALYDASFIIEVGQNDVMDQLAVTKFQPNAKSIQFSRFGQLSVDTSALDEVEDVVSEAVTDSKVVITPAEYGKAVTRTELASLQTGGVIDAVIPIQVAQHLSAKSNLLATTALLQSSNVLINGAAGTIAGLLSTDVIGPTFMNKAYNKLARKGNGLPKIAGAYIAVMHDDVIADLRGDTGAGSWQDVQKYTDASTVLNNEVGMYKGFRVIRNNALVGVDQTGAGTVDAYPVIFMAYNGLGKATSLEPMMVATGPFDKLARFVNIGWKGVFNYSIIEPDAVWVGYVASSLGNNAA